jgi:CheY-like chemotaxis protein
MPKVVLVGSDLQVRALLFGMLAEQGMSVVAADDAGDAIAQVNAMEVPPDIVLVDRRIVREGERELIDWMRSRSRFRQVPIVLFTAHGRESEGAPPLEDLRDSFDAALVLAIVRAVFETH